MSTDHLERVAEAAPRVNYQYLKPHCGASACSRISLGRRRITDRYRRSHKHPHPRSPGRYRR